MAQVVAQVVAQLVAQDGDEYHPHHCRVPGGVAVAQALHSAGQPVPPVLPASVPVALPGQGTSGNAVGVMLVRLPTDEPDPDRRLARIASATRSQKDDARGQGNVRCGVAAMSYAGRLGVALHCDADALSAQDAAKGLAAALADIAEPRLAQW